MTPLVTSAGHLTALLVFVAVSTASLQSVGATDSSRDRARTLAIAGAELFDAGRFAEALDRFREARHHFQAPTILVMEARSLVELGRLVEALSVYTEAEAQVLPVDASARLVQAKRDAAREAAEIRAMLPRLVVRVPTMIDALIISVDGAALTEPDIGRSLALDPGEHLVRAVAPGYVPMERTISLKVREEATLAIELRPVALVEPARRLRELMTDSEPGLGEERPLPVAGMVGLVSGGLALAASGVFFVVAQSEKSELESVCTPGCPQEYADDISAFRLHRTLAYVSLGTGLLSAGVGSYLLWGRDTRSSHARASVTPAGFVVQGAFR